MDDVFRFANRELVSLFFFKELDKKMCVIFVSYYLNFLNGNNWNIIFWVLAENRVSIVLGGKIYIGKLYQLSMIISVNYGSKLSAKKFKQLFSFGNGYARVFRFFIVFYLKGIDFFPIMTKLLRCRISGLVVTYLIFTSHKTFKTSLYLWGKWNWRFHQAVVQGAHEHHTYYLYMEP